LRRWRGSEEHISDPFYPRDPRQKYFFQSEIHVKSRKPRHTGKIGVSIWLAVRYGEADTTQFRIEK